MITLTITVLVYFGLYRELSKLTMAAKTLTVSSEGPAAENFPESMGQYKIIKDIYRHDRTVYKHVDREDRFIIFTGNMWTYEGIELGFSVPTLDETFFVAIEGLFTTWHPMINSHLSPDG